MRPDNIKLHTSLSSRVRFPTLFERFSSRFGTAIPNPNVDPERATNFEVGGSIDFSPRFRLEGAVFYSNVQDALVPGARRACCGRSARSTRPAMPARADYYGAELSLTAEVADWLDVGGNFTWIDRNYQRVSQITAVPGTTAPITAR
jgi:iron complex outermembrane receptor protein